MQGSRKVFVFGSFFGFFGTIPYLDIYPLFAKIFGRLFVKSARERNKITERRTVVKTTEEPHHDDDDIDPSSIVGRQTSSSFQRQCCRLNRR